MSKVTSITSSSHFSSITSSSSYVVVDFYADWCGPCKMISPVFEQLAQSEAKPGKLAFVKVNVDNQQDIARQYGVSAMPTFLILNNNKVIETIKGANTSALRSAILAASSAAAKGPTRSNSAFDSKGRTLGGSTGTAGTSSSSWNVPSGSVDGVVRFVALYVTTLFSFDSSAAAAASPFSRANR